MNDEKGKKEEENDYDLIILTLFAQLMLSQHNTRRLEVAGTLDTP